MDNQLFKKFDYYWILLILTVILCYGFFLTNHSMGIDDEILTVFSNPQIIMITNRPGNFIFSHVLQTYEYLPFWREFLGIALYTIGITLHSENFMKYLEPKFDKKAATIFSAIAVSFPYLAFHFLFIENMLQHGFIMIFTALAVRYFYKFFLQEKTKLNFILVLVSLFFAASFYESAVYYFVISCLIIEFLKFIFNKSEKFYNRVFFMCLFSFLCVSINVLICEIMKKIMHINYSKIDDFLLYDISSFSSFLKSFVNLQGAFIHKFIATCEYNFGSVIALISIIVFILFSLVYAFKKKNFNVIICSIFIILVPFSSLLILGNEAMPFRSYAPLSFLVALVFCLLFNQFKEKKVITNIVIALSIMVVVYNAQEQNQIYYTENLKYEDDKYFAYSIMYDLKKLRVDNKPIIFVGLKENPLLKYEYIESDEINISTFNWDRYDSFNAEIFVGRPYAFFKELGFEIKAFSDIRFDSSSEYETLLTEIKRNTKEMEIYPREDSIRDIGEYVIIKIGKSRADTE